MPGGGQTGPVQRSSAAVPSLGDGAHHGNGGTKCADFNFTSFNSYEDIEQELKCLAERWPACATLHEIGRTWERRPVYVVEVNSKAEARGSAIWVDGGTHAREWISVAVAMVLLRALVGRCEHARHDTVAQFQWFVAPVVNPDGYAFSRAHDRLWRKNRRPAEGDGGGEACAGVDLNRNYGFHWGAEGAGSGPCSEDFRGTAAFSEPEVQAVAAFLTARKEKVGAVLSLHSYGQMVIFPWDFSGERRAAHECVASVAAAMAAAMRAPNNRVYRSGQTHEILYPASGTFTDWLVGSLHINLAYVLELPDEGDRGFLLGSGQIWPTFGEVWAAVGALQRAVLRRACAHR